jgi:protein-S-isoprenylcysteine O-methyltransferase Ste14
MDFGLLNLPSIFGVGALIAFGLSERVFQILAYSQPRSAQTEKLSLAWLQIAYFGSILFSLFDGLKFHWTAASSSFSYLSYLGIPLVLIGIIARCAARWSLAENFSGRVQTFSAHRLITTGIYRWVQHPAYFAYFCLILGFPICLGSIGGLALAVVCGVPAVLYRIHVEEAALETWFGEEYREYQRRTPRLLPRVW